VTAPVDTTTDAWTTLAPPPAPITTYASAATDASRVFVWTAPDGRASVYDARTDVWSWLPEPPAIPHRGDSVWTRDEWDRHRFRR
jgi:hypothetical protein